MFLVLSCYQRSHSGSTAGNLRTAEGRVKVS